MQPSCPRAAAMAWRRANQRTLMKNPARAGFLTAKRVRALLLEPDAGKLLLEPREPPAAIHQLLLTTGPSRMRLRVDVEVHGVAFLAPGAAGSEFGAVGHHHLDSVIVRMQVEFHGSSSCARRARVASIEKSRGSIAQVVRGNKPRPKSQSQRRSGGQRPIATCRSPGHCRARFGPLSAEVAEGRLR